MNIIYYFPYRSPWTVGSWLSTGSYLDKYSIFWWKRKRGTQSDATLMSECVTVMKYSSCLLWECVKFRIWIAGIFQQQTIDPGCIATWMTHHRRALLSIDHSLDCRVHFPSSSFGKSEKGERRHTHYCFVFIWVYFISNLRWEHFEICVSQCLFAMCYLSVDTR